MSITFDFCSLNLILFSFVHSENLLTSTLAMFSASLIDYAFIIITKSSANVIVFIWLVYLRFKRELYCMFQNPVPHHEPCGQSLVIFFSSLQLFIDITALLSLK